MELPKSIYAQKFEEFFESINKNFNVFSDEGDDLPDGTRLTMMVMGLNLFVGNLLPGGEKGISLFKRAQPLTGISLMVGGLSGKKGYLYTPAVIALLYAGCITVKDPILNATHWMQRQFTVMEAKK